MQKLYKENKETLKQTHAIQVIFSIKFTNEVNHRTWSGNVIHVTGGRGNIRKTIQNEADEVVHAVQDKYDNEGVDPSYPNAIQIKHVYINKVKQDLTDYKDIKMFGTILEFCGYGLGKEEYKYENACVVEYHVEMFNRKRNQGWTIERFMNEIGMKSIDEGVTLNQLLPIYKNTASAIIALISNITKRIHTTNTTIK